MYAPLQAAWTQELALPHSRVVQHIKALWLCVVCAVLLGWTWACMAVVLFYAYFPTNAETILLRVSPYQLTLQQGNKSYSGHPTQTDNGLFWVYLKIQSYPITIWQWQVPARQWRQLRSLSHMWAVNHALTC